MARGYTTGEVAQAPRRKVEDSLLQSQKLEALGRLAGGVAHDFNNLLTVIEGYARLLKEECAAGGEATLFVEEILKAANRASNLTRQLLAFSRKQAAEPRLMNLNEAALGMKGMLERVIGEDVDLRVAVEASPATVVADPAQVEQVIMNLAVNARDAMPHGGRITIRTESLPGWVELSVSDSGHGIPEELQAQIFEPFFTTKEAGKGTGLGLALVRAIVEESQGRVALESRVGQGTTFRVQFPLRSGEPVAEADPAADVQAVRGRGTVLLVEDEEALRNLLTRSLTSRGYQVVQAADGEEALLRFRALAVPPDLLLTDVMLPRRSGKLVADELTKLAPRMKVLYMSGYGDNTPQGAVRLEKPFSPSKLASAVKDLIEKS
jgi:two-component system, cell cycle sensor histidine kinase and response regulator CckA